MTKKQTERGNKYALAALKDKRATIAGEIKSLERQLRHKREQLVHVDETLRLFDPAIAPDSLPAKKRYVNLFKQGELSRTVKDIFRKAGEPLTTQQVVDAVMEKLGHAPEARPAIRVRVQANLYYQRRNGTLESIAKQDGMAVWRLQQSQPPRGH